ncbi:MAG: hypothetical protein QOE89_2823, partial [Pseudonocardiales bacterium]|nr:hypothetical protein [Pseudonocardiales bacterium]
MTDGPHSLGTSEYPLKEDGMLSRARITYVAAGAALLLSTALASPAM